MINLQDFQTCYQQNETNDEHREQLIKEIRNFQRDAKRAISEVHKVKLNNGNFTKTDAILSASQKQGHKIVNEILPKLHRLKYENSFNNALEEYLEAVIFVNLKKSASASSDNAASDDAEREMQFQNFTFPDIKSQDPIFTPFITTNLYLGAISDVTGELGRLSVTLAMDKTNPEKSRKYLEKILSFMQEVYDEYCYVYDEHEEDEKKNKKMEENDKIKAINSNIKKVRDLLLQMVLSRPRMSLAQKDQNEAKNTRME